MEWREDGKRKREAVRKLGFEAIARRERKQRILAAQEAGIQVTDPDQSTGTTLAGAIETYLEDIRLTTGALRNVPHDRNAGAGTHAPQMAGRRPDPRHRAVRHKPEFGWTPKAYKEREIPIPDKLVQSLKAWKTKVGSNCPLVFPNSNCSPNGHFLRMCKAVAKRAELRTVQMWMGHTDLESTMRYLKPNRGKAVREKVNAMFD